MSVCEKCQEPIANDLKICRKCEAKKFTGGAKSLFGHLFHDVKTVAARMKKVRVKTPDKQ